MDTENNWVLSCCWLSEWCNL